MLVLPICTIFNRKLEYQVPKRIALFSYLFLRDKAGFDFAALVALVFSLHDLHRDGRLDEWELKEAQRQKVSTKHKA